MDGLELQCVESDRAKSATTVLLGCDANEIATQMKNDAYAGIAARVRSVGSSAEVAFPYLLFATRPTSG